MMHILFPVFAMFLLTAFCTLRLGFLRFRAVRRGEIDPRFFRLYQDYEEPEQLRVHSRHLVNLFETPVLFYVISMVALVTGQSGVLPVILAWGYVSLRYAHSWVHLRSNDVLLRFRIFGLSMLLLITLWAVVFIGMLLR